MENKLLQIASIGKVVFLILVINQLNAQILVL